MKLVSMGSSILLVLSICVPGWSQYDLAGYQQPSQYPQTQCGRDCIPPRQPMAPQQQPVPQQAPGYFAAPPQNGPVAGESRGVGLNGFAIHIPAMSLRLPTIEFPSLFRVRRNPHMMIDAAQAPYMQYAAVAQATPMQQQALTPTTPPQAPIPPQAPEPPPAPPNRPQPPAYTPPQRQQCEPLPPPVPTHLRCDETFSQNGSDAYLRQQLMERERQIQALQSQVDQLSQVTQRLVEMNRGQQPQNHQAQPNLRLVSTPLESAQPATTRPLYVDRPVRLQPPGENTLRQAEYQRPYSEQAAPRY